MVGFERLPTHVRPVKYTLEYTHLDLDACLFEGNVSIDVVVEPETTATTITMHANDLWIRTAALQSQANSSVAAAVTATRTDFDVEAQTVTFTFGPTALPSGNCKLYIEFHGDINNKLAGLYRSFYTVGKERRCMAVTQFEPTDARRAFPCFDEPAIKASFQLTVHTPTDRMCISNTRVIRACTQKRTSPGGKVTDVKVWSFAETPVMSTYLVALVVGEFDVVSSTTKGGVLTSVYMPLGKGEMGEFALRMATQSLDFFNKVFGVQYPLTKSDLIAIPDFAAGAMENFGCVTYRSTKIEVDELNGTTSQAALLGSARTVAHEQAHQWFGNTVTMEWWSDLWLNEGFARYMEFLATDAIMPNRTVWMVFIQDVQDLALAKDALMSSHPVYVEVGHPDEINAIFDTISYAKGASLILMLQEYIGINAFIRGVRFYMTKHLYANATSRDLWTAIEEANSMPTSFVSNLMTAWLERMGYPLVYVHQVEEGSLQVKQRRYLSDTGSGSSAAQTAEVDPTKWPVPVRVAWREIEGGGGVGRTCAHFGEYFERYFLLSDPADEQALDALMSDLHGRGQVGVLNHGSVAFFRTCYKPDQYVTLALMIRAEQQLAKEAGDVDSDKSMQTPGPILDLVALAGATSVGVGEGMRFETIKNSGPIMSALDRLSLVRDAFACASSGQLSHAVPLRLCASLLHADGLDGFITQSDSATTTTTSTAETSAERVTAAWTEQNPFVLLEIVRNLLSLGGLFRREDFFELYAVLVQRMCAPLLARLGWEEALSTPNNNNKKPNPIEASLRPVVLRASALAVDTGKSNTNHSQGGKTKSAAETAASVIQEKALLMFDAHCSGSKTLSPDLHSLVFSIASRAQSTKTLAKLLALYERDDITPHERRQVLVSVGTCGAAAGEEDGDDAVLQQVMDFALNSGKVRNQDLPAILGSLGSSPKSGTALWNNVKKNYEWWYDTFGKSGSFVWGSVLGAIVRGQKTPEAVADVEAFFFVKTEAAVGVDEEEELVVSTLHPLGAALRNVRQALESARARTRRLERAREPMAEFLKALQGVKTTASTEIQSVSAATPSVASPPMPMPMPMPTMSVSKNEDNASLLRRVPSQCSHRLTGHTGRVRALVLCGDMLMSASSDHTIICWDTTSWKQLAMLKGHVSTVRALAAKDGLLFSGSNMSLRVWDLSKFECIKVIESPKTKQFNVAAAAEEGGSASASVLHEGQYEKIYALEMCGSQLISCQSSGQIKVWGNADSSSNSSSSGAERTVSNIESNSMLVDSTWGCVKTLEDHEWAVLALRVFVLPISQGGVQALASGAFNGDIQIHNSQTWERMATLQGHMDKIWSFASLGNLLVSASGEIKIWSMDTFACVRTLERHFNIVRDLVVLTPSPNSGNGATPATADDNDAVQYLVSASDDRTIRIWNTKSWECERTLMGHQDGVRAVITCGGAIISGSYDRTLVVWTNEI